jgi:hypothetical protein
MTGLTAKKNYYCSDYQLLTFGIASSFIIMYSQPLEDFGASKALTASIFNLGRAATYFAGQLSKFLRKSTLRACDDGAHIDV